MEAKSKRESLNSFKDWFASHMKIKDKLVKFCYDHITKKEYDTFAENMMHAELMALSMIASPIREELMKLECDRENLMWELQEGFKKRN